jgi:hypothetical protein
MRIKILALIRGYQKKETVRENGGNGEGLKTGNS